MWTIVSSSPPLGDHGADSPLGVAPASRHVIGTARMGDDPTTSVVDPTGHLWDVENVMIADSSVFPTSTGYGPTLTLAALSARASRLLAGRPVAPRTRADVGTSAAIRPTVRHGSDDAAASSRRN